MCGTVPTRTGRIRRDVRDNETRLRPVVMYCIIIVIVDRRRETYEKKWSFFTENEMCDGSVMGGGGSRVRHGRDDRYEMGCDDTGFVLQLFPS